MTSALRVHAAVPRNVFTPVVAKASDLMTFALKKSRQLSRAVHAVEKQVGVPMALLVFDDATKEAIFWTNSSPMAWLSPIETLNRTPNSFRNATSL